MALDYGINDVLNPFLPSIAFHIEPIHLIYIINQMTSFFMKRNSRLGSEGKEIVSFYVLLLIFLAAACFVMAVYL